MKSCLSCLPPALFLLLAATLPVRAGQSPWQDFEGARLRLVTEDAPQADGSLRAALQIALKPGWKTYWREPGDAGIPPMVKLETASGARPAAISFPLPRRFKDAYSTWAGYDAPVSLALTLQPFDPADAPHVSAFLGICKEICIPVQADLEVAPGEGEIADDLVAAAFAALPSPAKPGLEVTGIDDGDGTLTARVDLPDGAGEASLFLAGGQGWYFGQPKWDGASSFAVTVYDRPDQPAAEAPSWDYTLVADGQAVSGTVTLGR